MTRKCGGQVWAVLSKPVSWLSSCVSGFSLHLLRVLEYLSFSHSALSPSSAGFLTQAHLSVHLALTHYFLWPCCLHLLWPSSPLPQPNSSFLAPHLLIWTCGKSHGRRSLVGGSPRVRKESDTTERLPFPFSLSYIGEGNGNPIQCSCLENPRDGGAWLAAIYGIAQTDMTEAT